MSHVRFWAAAGSAVCLAGGLVLAQGKPAPKPPDPMTIDILGVKDGLVSLQTAGAWPLTIRLSANDPLGIGTYTTPYLYPLGPQQAYVVFKDPDGCFSLTYWTEPGGMSPCPDYNDETYLEFTPTINLPNLPQTPEDKVLPAPLGVAPSLMAGTDPAQFYRASIGPIVGPADTADNYGYGASPNLPGLVIVSNRGLGLKWDESSDEALHEFRLVQPRTARNLAGFINSVAWTLNDCIGWKTAADGCAGGRTGVTAHINVPHRLFSPVVRLDLGYTNAGVTTGRAFQIDGGEWVPDNNFALLGILRQMITTVRVFAVSGKGPDELADLDGDGVVTAKDAVHAGYKLVAGEKVFYFKIYHQTYSVGLSELGTLYDHNRDGMQGEITPGGGGGVTPVPR